MKKVVDIPELIDLNSLIVNTNFFYFSQYHWRRETRWVWESEQWTRHLSFWIKWLNMYFCGIFFYYQRRILCILEINLISLYFMVFVLAWGTQKFLSKHLHLFQDIPLRVSSVQPLDPPTFSLLEILVHALLSLFKRFVICYYYYYYYYYFLGKRDLLFD